jgi:hypothetical protein
MYSKHRWALLLLGALLIITSSAWAGKKTEPPKPEPPKPPVEQPAANHNTNTALGVGLGYGEGGDADARSEAAAHAGAAAVVGDTTAVGVGGSGGAGGAGGQGGDGGNAVAGGGNATAQGGVGLGGAASQGQSQGIASSGNSASTSHGGASQARGGDQSQGQSSVLTGGNNEASSAARGGDQSQTSNSGGNSIDVDASSQHHTLFIPSVTQGIAPSIVPGANVTAQASAVCGPRQEVVSEAVSGTFHGLFVRRGVDQGTTDTLRPAPQAFRTVNYPDGTTRYYGHQVTTYVAAVGVSGARSLALGGGGSRGDWGQGSLGTSSANQRLVIKHVLTECELGASPPPLVFSEPRTPRG